MRRSNYPTDLSDVEWACLKLHLPVPKQRRRGRPKIYSSREILNAIFYLLKSGCPWRLLPRDFPPWKTVYHWFRKWRIDGTFERLNAALCERLRARLERNPQPSVGIVDSQSAKTSGVGGEHRGYDGGRKVRGRKRHLLVGTEGLILKAKVHSAKVPDQDGINLLLTGVRDRLPRLSQLWVDAGYQGRGKDWVEKVLGRGSLYLLGLSQTFLLPEQAPLDGPAQDLGQLGAELRQERGVAILLRNGDFVVGNLYASDYHPLSG